MVNIKNITHINKSCWSGNFYECKGVFKPPKSLRTAALEAVSL